MASRYICFSIKAESWVNWVLETDDGIQDRKQHPTDGRIIASELTGFVTCEPETYDLLHDCFEPVNNPTDPDIVDVAWETEEALNL